MTILKAFPDATWVGSKRDGKVWIGTTAPKVVLHTLEFNAWPDPDRWDSPSHLVCNPNTGEVRQYLPMDKAAYAVRDNAQENDEPTFQVELWGNAANVPRYSDEWYEGVAGVCQTFVEEYGIPPTFADFTHVVYGAYAPQRMSDEDVTAFTGFLGHCHMGYGTDTHWDPGELDTDKVLSYMTAPDPEDTMPDLDTFVTYIRKTDIAKMGDDNIITADETLYFTGDEMWIDDHTKVDPEHPDWANLYNAWRVRSPIWAV